MISSFLFVTVSPGSIDQTASILSLGAHYNEVPYTDEETELALSVTKKQEEATVLDVYSGTITAYGPDCIGCIGITASGYKVAEMIDGVMTSITTTYTDDEFGEVRILAAAPAKFPYGTILRVSGDRIDGYITGIVLDTGGAMRNAWARGEVLIDLMFASEKLDEVAYFGRQKNVTFEVLRYGK